MNNFPGSVRSPQMFKYKDKTAFTCNIQSAISIAKFISIAHCIQASNSQHKLGAKLLLLALHLKH